MPGNDEKTLLFVAVGVVFFSMLAIALFLLGAGILFYVSAILAIILGFYLTHSLSKSSAQEPKHHRRKSR